MQFITTPDAPMPRGHYSQAIVHNYTIYVAGILPINKNGEKLTDAPIEVQTQQVLENLDAILSAAGSKKAYVLKTTVFITDIDDWEKVNQIYATFFGEHKPARSVVPISTLHYGLNIEIEAIAAIVEN